MATELGMRVSWHVFRRTFATLADQVEMTAGQRHAAFKRSLGRGTVDLRGPHAPHMLQAITVSAMGDTIKLEITGDAADRAHGHNEGTSTLPRRRFFDASVLEQVEMQDELWEMMQARLDRL